jgi:hypothetical protein
MLLRPIMRAVLRATVLAVALSAAGCGHWPWHRAPPAAPVPVHELDVEGANATAFTQYWKRNTLLVDLSSASGSGSITLKPTAGSTWPVRVGIRVSPGTIGVLEVRGAQRTSLPIESAAGPPIDLELAPAIYPPATKQMTVSWGPLQAPAP